MRTMFPVLFAAILTISALPVSAATNEAIFEAGGIDRDAALVNLRFDRVHNAIILDDSRLYEDDAPGAGTPEGYNYRGTEWKEDLRKGIVAKKILVVDNPAAFGGRLLIKAIETPGNTAPLKLSVNGVAFVRPASVYEAATARQYTNELWDRWFYIDMPSGALKKGENEILLSADSDSTAWQILISLEKEFARGSTDRPHHPNRSMKSSDGGATWSDSKLGTANAVDGEYNVRVSLDQYVPRGEYLSPVIDVVDDSSPLKLKTIVQSVECLANIDTPEGTSAAVSIRFGTSPFADDTSWTKWTSLMPGQPARITGNYRCIQWKASLETANPLKTPSINGFSVKAVYDDISTSAKTGLHVSVEKNGHVARMSYPFEYENLNHPGLVQYRKTFRLDEVVEGAQTEFEKMMRLLHWAYRIPVTSNAYSWNWNDVPLLVKDENGKPKLQMDYSGRRRDAMCLYPNQALIGALLAFGFQARHINIHSEGVSGHEVTEVWSDEFDKWIYMDATRDYYYFDLKTGTPLNLLEIHNLMIEQVPNVETWQRPFAIEYANQIGVNVNIGMREGDNPVSIVEHGTHILELMGHFRIIPRNNFLSKPLPVPVHTGETMWGWDGFLNWYDAKFPKRWEYQRQTDRAPDFYEPLNQSEVYLFETDSPGVLKVAVDTFTPGGFDTFLVRIDDGSWFEMKRPAWDWPITGGIHTLEVRTRNVRGVLGPVSRLAVTYNP